MRESRRVYHVDGDFHFPLTTRKGMWRYTVSPKTCSLAFDEVKDNSVLQMEPELNLLVKSAIRNSYPTEAADDVVYVEGRITISF